MTEDEAKQFIGSGLQQLMVREHKKRLAQSIELFLTCKPEDLLSIQAAAKAIRMSLLDISITEEDIIRLSAEAVDEMEEIRKASQAALEAHVRERATRASLSQ